jgi:NTE family protein
VNNLAVRIPKLGIALSGGGIRGAVHFGILKVLKQNRIIPDMLAGTSAGSIAGAFFACDVDIDDFMNRKFKEINALNILDPAFSCGYLLMLMYYYWTKRPMTMWTFPDGLFKGEKIEKYLEDLFGRRKFKDLKIPLTVISVDIDTGETVVFCPNKCVPKSRPADTVYITDASVAEAVRASISLPGVFIPKRIKGRRLVDGGIKNNIPLDVLYHQGADKIIAIDLGVTKKRAKADSIVEILMATVDIMGDELSSYIRRSYPGYIIFPDLRGGSYKDFSKVPKYIKYGEDVCKKSLPGIKDFIGNVTK